MALLYWGLSKKSLLNLNNSKKNPKNTKTQGRPKAVSVHLPQQHEPCGESRCPKRTNSTASWDNACGLYRPSTVTNMLEDTFVSEKEELGQQRTGRETEGRTPPSLLARSLARSKSVFTRTRRTWTISDYNSQEYPVFSRKLKRWKGVWFGALRLRSFFRF